MERLLLIVIRGIEVEICLAHQQFHRLTLPVIYRVVPRALPQGVLAVAAKPSL